MNLFVIGVESGTSFSIEGRAFTTEAEAEEYAKRMNKACAEAEGDAKRWYIVWPVEVA